MLGGVADDGDDDDADKQFGQVELVTGFLHRPREELADPADQRGGDPQHDEGFFQRPVCAVLFFDVPDLFGGA